MNKRPLYQRKSWYGGRFCTPFRGTAGTGYLWIVFYLKPKEIVLILLLYHVSIMLVSIVMILSIVKCMIEFL